MINERGFQITPNVLSGADCDALIEQLAGVARSRAGARHLLSVSAVVDIAAGERIRNIASSVLETRAVPYRATLFDKSSESNWSVIWHQDTALPLVRRFARDGWGPWSVKTGVNYAHAPASALERIVALRLHLDDSTSTNGPLRVIPGSHLLGVLTDDQVSMIAHSAGFTECLVPRGGVLAMRPLLIHSSSRVTSIAPRRVLHIEYADQLELEPGIQLAAA